jgi:hypothetical protein
LDKNFGWKIQIFKTFDLGKNQKTCECYRKNLVPSNNRQSRHRLSRSNFFNKLEGSDTRYMKQILTYLPAYFSPSGSLLSSLTFYFSRFFAQSCFYFLVGLLLLFLSFSRRSFCFVCGKRELLNVISVFDMLAVLIVRL